MKIETKNFDNLDFEKQCEIINASPFSEKGDLILRSSSPEVIVPSLACEDFYLIYSSAGSELQPEFLRFARSDQLVFASDFECWEKDEIADVRFLGWIGMLQQTGREQFLNWLADADFELILSGLLSHVEVIKTQHLELIDDYIGDRPFFSLDNLYYVCIEGDDFEVVRHLIETLFQTNRTRYMQLVEGLICVNALEVLEESYQLRNRRLAHYGFPDKDEAMRIYLPVSDWDAIEEKNAAIESEIRVPPEVFRTTYPILRDRRRIFLDDALSLYEEFHPNDHGIFVEFVAIANKIIVCEELDFRNDETMRYALARARKVVSLALEDLSGSKIERAAELLRRHWVETFHRWGITRLRQLRGLGNDIYQKSGFKSMQGFSRFLGAPWKYHFQGIMRFYPMKARDDAETEVVEIEDFESLPEVERFFREIREIDAVLDYLGAHFGRDWDRVLGQDYANVELEGENVDLAGMLATLCAHLCLNGRPSFEPLSVEGVKDFIRKAFEGESPLRTLRPTVRSALVREVLGDGADGAHPVLDRVCDRIRDEAGGVNLDLPLDTRFIPVFLTKKKSGSSA